MDDSTLRSRLDAIERRLTLVSWLLAGMYVFGTAWLLVETFDAVTVYSAAVGVVALAVVASMSGVYRRRRARR
ncbi:hypothetical protein [Halosimplex salinum]|uniref:hypothetical protein n=1 Tax=Halosimplex salinum TaxID=1710538 RepID=UPI000F4623F0|nr:hypothetical protein [Halosimplex salinum]